MEESKKRDKPTDNFDEPRESNLSNMFSDESINTMTVESEDNSNDDYNYNLHSWSRPHLRGKDLVPKCAIACSVICEKPVQNCALCIHKTCKGI